MVNLGERKNTTCIYVFKYVKVGYYSNKEQWKNK